MAVMVAIEADCGGLFWFFFNTPFYRDTLRQKTVLENLTNMEQFVKYERYMKILRCIFWATNKIFASCKIAVFRNKTHKQTKTTFDAISSFQQSSLLRE